MRVFISYARDDLSEVQPFVERLREDFGSSVFWDQEIPAGKKWLDELARGINRASSLVVFVSPQACRSSFVQNEIICAEKNGATVIPLFLAKIPDHLSSSGLMLAVAGRQNIPTTDTFQSAYELLLGALRESPSGDADLAVIALMGVKGGVGKSTIATTMAELIASTGASVLMVDADIETAGLTKYIGSRARERLNVTSVLEAAHLRTRGATRQGPISGGLWDVTPPYLRHARFGRVYLGPGRLPGDVHLSYEAIANLPPKQRNRETLSILSEVLDRRHEVQNEIQAVVIDSGAENNPLVSAAFVLAKAGCGFIVSAPNPEFASEIPRLDGMHRQRYPDARISSMNVIVNRATPKTASLWKGTGRMFLVPEDDSVRVSGADGTYDFEGLGLNSFMLSIRSILEKSLGATHAYLVPDERKVWIRPWLARLVEKKLPDTMVRSRDFRTRVVLAPSLFLLAMLVAILLGYGTLAVGGPEDNGNADDVALIQVDDRDTAVEARVRLSQGQPLAAVARTYSTDNFSSQRGGVATLQRYSDEIEGVGTLMGVRQDFERLSPGEVSRTIYELDGKFFVMGKLAASPTGEVRRRLALFGLFLGMMIALLASVFLGVYAFKMLKRRQLLKSIALRGTEDAFMLALLKQPERGALKWLKDEVRRSENR